MSAEISRDFQTDFELTTTFKLFLKIFFKLFFITYLFHHTSPKRPDKLLTNIMGNPPRKGSVTIEISKPQKGEGLKITIFT